MLRKSLPLIFLGAVLFCLAGAVVLYSLPPIHDRLGWRVENLAAKARELVDPPQKDVFVPEQQQIANIVQATFQAMTLEALARATPTPQPTQTPALPEAGAATPVPSNTPTPIPTPIPAQVTLTGTVHEYQKWNNCGPATLAVALTFWGWKGNQMDVASVVKPNARDKNVMPYELADYVTTHTGLKAVVRFGGDLELLKELIAGGFPVVIEKGFEPKGEAWMGHYEVLTGYDETRQQFIAQDVYILPDLPVSYVEVESYWQNFNYVYLVIYPPERESQVMAILGPQADETGNYQYAARKASVETQTFTGRALYFAWYNLGTSLVRLQDFGGAATAYDKAFAIYPDVPEEKRPWRMVWYQTGPYFAYYFTGRYNDVIRLATATMGLTSEPALEESWYWRAMAEAALGDKASAIEDLHASLKWHPGFGPSLQELQVLGATP